MKIKGYLRLTTTPGASKPRLSVPNRFQPPKAVGNWEYFQAPEAQGNLPWCASFSECAILQAAAWRHPACGYPVQYSEKDVYVEAKRIDKDNEDGTSLDSVISAAEKLFSVRCNELAFTNSLDILWVIHQYGAAMIGMDIDEGWETPRKEDGLVTPRGVRLGGHAVVATWYRIPERRIGGLNWWGQQWGNNGQWSMTFEAFEKQFIYGYAQRIEFLLDFQK